MQHTLGTSYLTVWNLLHRYRIAMGRIEREQLSGMLRSMNVLWAVLITVEKEGEELIKL